ncbi:Retrovirus-related Pol polyprotein from transposon TNT 1-94 [Gossypium australe]|uniref:Retrovirus-related Pol polyprotein from transposon TNT 1-94 n=1 Tax=Gossypium australe TaxID=47621 RepID=A0A5B6UWT4_9ROSI|nr:Retrovirus-related Pol polyprotein from transposon TNT 1-94 [Gossypium australe]
MHQCMTSNESIFKKLDKSYISKVRVGNGKLIQAKGKVDVLINTLSSTKVISDVLLVPEINHNLLSIGQHFKKNYNVVFKDSGCTMSFVLDWNLANSRAYASSVDETKLWHR